MRCRPWAEGLAAAEAPIRSARRLVVPSIVLGEYYFGIRQSRHRRRYEAWLRRHLPLAEMVTVTSATADLYAEIRLELKRTGTPIPSNGRLDRRNLAPTSPTGAQQRRALRRRGPNPADRVLRNSVQLRAEADMPETRADAPETVLFSVIR